MPFPVIFAIWCSSVPPFQLKSWFGVNRQPCSISCMQIVTLANVCQSLDGLTATLLPYCIAAMPALQWAQIASLIC